MIYTASAASCSQPKDLAPVSACSQQSSHLDDDLTSHRLHGRWSLTVDRQNLKGLGLDHVVVAEHHVLA